jgi:hypothetical protein
VKRSVAANRTWLQLLSVGPQLAYAPKKAYADLHCTVSQVLTAFVPIKDLLFYIDFKTPDAIADTVAVVRRFGIEERVIMGAIPTVANLEVRPKRNRTLCEIQYEQKRNKRPRMWTQAASASSEV